MVGTFLFIIISSYFLIDSQELKLGKLLNLVLCTSLYSVVSLCFASVYLGDYISIKEIIKAILSPVLDNYWYITGYIVLYMLHPILNAMLAVLTDKQRDLIHQQFVLGKTHQEIADDMGMSRGSVTRAVNQALERIRRKFDFEAHYELAAGGLT